MVGVAVEAVGTVALERGARASDVDVQQAQLARDEGCVAAVAGPGAGVYDVEAGVDACAGVGELAEGEGGCLGRRGDEEWVGGVAFGRGEGDEAEFDVLSGVAC